VKKSEYNNTLKQTKEGKKTLNTVYIKYELHEKINKEVIVKVGNYTITVTGDESDIRKEIKNFIAYEIILPYVVKVVILRVTINKDDKDTDYYKWKGAEKTEEKGIIYMKAWQCKFVHHGFNVDKNDETPFECVPNALFKMYGDKTKGKTYYAYDWCHYMVLQPETPVTVYTVVDDHFQLVDKSAECFENVRNSEYPIFEYTYNGKTYKPLDGDILTPAFSKERKNKELHNFEELLKQRKVEYKVLEDDSAYYVLVHKKFSEKLLRIAIELVNDDIADYEDCVGEFILMQFNGEDQLWRFMED
jgi:hypothetical protein